MNFLTRKQALLGALAGALLASPAGAFCRATTCLADPEAVCSWDDNGCVFEGVPLGWPLGASVSIELDTQDVDETTAQHLDESLRAAVASWLAVRCTGGESLGLGGAGGDSGAGGAGGELSAPTPPTGGSAPDLQVKVVSKKGNVVVRPIAAEWPYGNLVIAKSIIDFSTDSGTLDGATLELNLVDFHFTGEPSMGKDVDTQAVLTHELGHIFGLDHTLVEGATMEAETSSTYSSRLRTLEPDDGDAICSLYPPAENSEPEVIDLSPDVIPATSGESCQISSIPLARTPGAGLAALFLGLIGLAAFRGSRRRSYSQRPNGLSASR
jgi:hypothetical protein